MHDVIVVGAGPGGASAAYFLAQQGVDVLVLDKALFPRDKTCGDGLLPRALGILGEMGKLPEIEKQGFRVNRITAYYLENQEVSSKIIAHNSLPDYALVVPRYKLDNIILETAQSKGAKFIGNNHVVDVRKNDKDKYVVVAECAGKQLKYHARLVVIAAGANLALLRNIGVLKKDIPIALATRAYYDGVSGLTDTLELYLGNVQLPGYAWVFPTSADSANVGVGCFPHWLRKTTFAPAKSLNLFLSYNRRIQSLLAQATLRGHFKGFPLRTDFATAPTHADGIMLVGESLGLVNPISGDGIDFALESGKIVAQHIPTFLRAGNTSFETLNAYGKELKSRFQAWFADWQLMRDLYMSPWLLKRLFKATAKSAELRQLVMDAMIGQIHPKEAMSMQRIFQVLKS